MSPSRGRQSGTRRSNRPRRNSQRSLWAAVAAPDAPELIRPAPDPTALIDSLGTPPLRGHGSTAEHYVAAVVERAAALATALAASAGLLAPPEEDGDS
ncbi:MAG TPA: hypothetical protein VGZ52_01255 [Acidimicrobiales bacterium]|nr:hypothetical protein [Acidimicrobiales bacterium]